MNKFNLAASLCIVGAIYLLTQHIDGWGWLLFIAFCALESSGDSIEIVQCEECGICRLCEHEHD